MNSFSSAVTVGRPRERLRFAIFFFAAFFFAARADFFVVFFFGIAHLLLAVFSPSRCLPWFRPCETGAFGASPQFNRVAMTGHLSSVRTSRATSARFFAAKLGELAVVAVRPRGYHPLPNSFLP